MPTHTNASPLGDDEPSQVSGKSAAEISSVGVAQASLILALGYVVISAYSLFALPAPHNFTLFALTSLTSLSLFGIFLINRVFKIPAYLIYPLFTLICFLILGNIVIQCVLLVDEKYLAGFYLISIGVSLVFFSSRMLFLFYALVLSSFIWTLQYIQSTPDYAHHFFMLGCSFLIGFLSVTVRKNTLRHLILTRALAQSKSERLEDALSASRRGIKAQQDNHSKSNFLAHMSHELRTPLTAIIGFSDIIRLELFGAIKNDRYAEYVTDIHSSSEHLLSLVNDILDLSKLEENMVEVSLTTVDLGETLERSLSMIRERAVAHGVALEYRELHGDRDIYCDPLRLKQIVLNLLSNAVKFTGSEGLVILEPLVDDAGNLSIEVRDTGVGMSPEEIENAMEPFWQAKAYRSSPTEGTGLGLALSKELAVLLGGHLEIESEPNVGTIARLVLPFEAITLPTETKKPLEAESLQRV
ncbi:MAG: HAMP domain-containing histidine kinase [Parvibaculaceae bacterium]|nr:HAMP domain-containing histidine kinase [Parvibaculaceae bacterium]